MNHLSKAILLGIAMLPNLAWSLGETCNAILNLGLYNVSQSSSAKDGQYMALATFCSYDYSRSDLSTSQSAAIDGSYGLFSAGASGSASRSEIIEKQRSVCTSGFGSAKYSNKATEYSRAVYQGTLDAWNKCQALSNKGLVFEVQPSSTLQGISVIMTAPTGLSAKFLGVFQNGAGQSSCVTTANGKLIMVGPSTPFTMTAASKVTINCARVMQNIGDDMIADAQDLVFATSADTLTLPLAAIGNMSRATVDQIKADLALSTKSMISTALKKPNDSISSLNNAVSSLNGVVAAGFAWEVSLPYSSISPCDGPAALNCMAGAHRHCITNGGKGGFIQEWSNDGIAIVCVK